MKMCEAGKPTTAGLYVSFNPMDVRYVGADGEVLNGKKGARYHRLSPVIMLFVSPFIGGLFVMTFPFLVLMLIPIMAARALWKALHPHLSAKAHLSHLRWEPTMAYLAKPKKDEESKETEKKEE